MLNQGWRSGLALLAAFGIVSLAVLPGPAGAAVRRESREFAGSAAADSISDSQQWVLEMLRVEAAWSVTRGSGVTVAVIDSGVNPDVSDLAGSVVTGPDYTGVTTSPASSNWGVHGTWMASLIAGHGHDGGLSGVVGVAPDARILSIRVSRIDKIRTTASTSGSRRPSSSSRWLTGSPTRWRMARGSSACPSATARRAARSGARCRRPTTAVWW